MPDLIDLIDAGQIRRELDRAGLAYVETENPAIAAQMSLWLNALLAQPRNLTAVNTPQSAIAKHVIEPLIGRHRLIQADLPVPHGPSIDIGSGNGAPGLPIALCEPQRPATLLESRRGAAEFLNSVVARLDGPKIEVFAQRAEQAGQADSRGRFSLATSRAAAPPPIAMELTIPLLAVGGIAMLWTGALDEPTIADLSVAANQLGAELTMLDPPHDIVVATKLRATDARYPRSWNRIRRRPLGLSRIQD